MHREHERSTLARTTFCGVELCPCGTLYLTVGAVTVRFPRDVMREVVETLIRAEHALQETTRDRCDERARGGAPS
jgi:hypothetical protein